MNPKTLLASVIMLAFTLLASPAQQVPPPPQPEPPAPVATPDQITVNVLAEVNRPARIILPRGGTILDAVAAAGGLTRVADSHHATLIHKSAGAKPDSVEIDLKPILLGKAKDVTLRDGDTVVIAQEIF